jgi:curved DNA-binding protein
MDIYLVVDILPDQRYERKENQLYTDVTIDVYTAILGGQVNVITPGGSVLLTIPPGTQPGQTFRLTGRGMPLLKNPSTQGDLFVRAHVSLPKTLTEEEKKAFHKLSGRSHP